MEQKVKSALWIREAQLFLDECIRTRELVRVLALKKDGSIVTYDGWLVSSQNWKAGTHKLRNPKNGEVRQISDVLIFEINGHPIYL